MKLEEEKELVATRLMGWTVEYREHNGKRVLCIFDGEVWTQTLFGWSPQSERKWWDELLEKIDGADIWDEFIDEIDAGILSDKIASKRTAMTHGLTIKTELLWAGLVRLLNV